MRAVYPFLLLAVASAPALAQNTSQNPSQPNTTERGQLSTQEQKADDRREPRVERIVVEDAGSRVDELRVGGQTVAYYSTTGASIGFQAGGQSRSVIYVFNTQESLAKFRASNG
ncbi:MAG TPA: twin-arginine translocation pathway signal, partial [Alicycliphilus sp.]|nr:twin-arginine translocation pathway signal [Alicycliphilus sp.]